MNGISRLFSRIGQTRFFKWFVRCRIYSDYGVWWLPGFELIMGVFGVVTFGLWGMSIYFMTRALFTIIGFIDVKYVKRAQYQNEFTTRDTNPYFEKIEKDIKRLERKIDELHNELPSKT